MCVDVNPFVAYWQVFDLFGLVYVKILDVGFNSGFFQDGWVIFETGLCALMLFELTLKVGFSHFRHPMKKWRISFFCGSSRRLILVHARCRCYPEIELEIVCSNLGNPWDHGHL